MIVQFNKKVHSDNFKKILKKILPYFSPAVHARALEIQIAKDAHFFYQKNVCHSGSDLEKAFCTIMVFVAVHRYPYT